MNLCNPNAIYTVYVINAVFTKTSTKLSFHKFDILLLNLSRILISKDATVKKLPNKISIINSLNEYNHLRPNCDFMKRSKI